jgi:hypothetical protein
MRIAESADGCRTAATRQNEAKSLIAFRFGGVKTPDVTISVFVISAACVVSFTSCSQLPTADAGQQANRAIAATIGSLADGLLNGRRTDCHKTVDLIRRVAAAVGELHHKHANQVFSRIDKFIGSKSAAFHKTAY